MEVLLFRERPNIPGQKHNPGTNGTAAMKAEPSYSGQMGSLIDDFYNPWVHFSSFFNVEGLWKGRLGTIGIGLISSSENLVSWRNTSFKDETHCKAAPIEHSMTVRLSERGYLHLCVTSFLIASASELSRPSIDSNAADLWQQEPPFASGIRYSLGHDLYRMSQRRKATLRA
jgi:hypothetical protein